MNETPELVAARERAFARTPAERARLEHERVAHERIAQAVKDRHTLIEQGFPCPPAPTGVRYKSALTGRVQNICDDGSVRNLWMRAPGVSGRQFRKMRKVAQRAAREEQRRALQPIVDLLPRLPGHRHIIGENLLPQCGCTYTPEALAKLRALMVAPGTEHAEESVNPVTPS